MLGASRRRVWHAHTGPIVTARIVSSASIQLTDGPTPAPDNHFSAGPDCGVNESGAGHGGRAGRSPTVGARTVPRASVREDTNISLPSPDDHFHACPHGRVSPPRSGSIRVGGNPGIIAARSCDGYILVHRRFRYCGKRIF